MTEPGIGGKATEDDRTDLELLRLTGEGDPRAFAAFHGRYATDGLSVARSICHDRGLAEDVLQEAFVDIWRSHPQYRPELGSFRSWALAIVRHRAIDHRRRPTSRATLALGTWEEEVASFPATSTIDDDVVRDLEFLAVKESLLRLPPLQAEAIELAFLCELSSAEIAVRLSIPVATVKGRIRLGLARLRGELGRRRNT